MTSTALSCTTTRKGTTYCSAADRGLTPHSLRHTAASLAIAAGADVKVVQTMLGHKDAAMTLNVYAGLLPDRLHVVADALDDARRTLVRPAIEVDPT